MLAKFLNPIMQTMRAAIVLIVVAWILNIPGQLQIGLFTEQMLAAVLGLSLALTFLTFPLHMGQTSTQYFSGITSTGEEAVVLKLLTGTKETAGPVDIVLAALSLACCFYVAIRYPQLIRELVDRPVSGIIIATIIVLLVFEASRRVTGLALVLIVLVLCAHALLGWMLPDMFASRYVSLSRLMVYLGVDTNALLGNTLQIAVIVVVPFIIMGQVLMRCGGSDFFSDLASALMGQFRGGAAKIAVVGSAFFGMVSGSAVANVASVGTITIPLMKRAGFPPHIAAAIEAVGSTGGQIAPPVMGAAAFLMAEYLRVPYAEVMVAAIIPALLYYAALFIQVDLESAKRGILGSPRSSLPSVGKVMREGWQFLVPFVVLVGGLLWLNWEPEYAALFGTAVLIVLVLIVPHKGRRMSIREVVSAVVGAGGAVIDIIAITAIAGILIGAMNITGVAFSLTQQLLTVSGGSLPLLLVITAFAVVHPRPAAADARRLRDPGDACRAGAGAGRHLADAGAYVRPVQRHVGDGDAAGRAVGVCRRDHRANRTNGRPAGAPTRMSWCSYLIPFMFAYTPALVMNGSPGAILVALSVALLGVLMGTVASGRVPGRARAVALIASPTDVIALMLLRSRPCSRAPAG